MHVRLQKSLELFTVVYANMHTRTDGPGKRALSDTTLQLIQLNRRALPAAIKLGGARLVAMIVVVLFYGYFSARLVIAQAGALFGG